MERPAARTTGIATREAALTARVALLISTHAIPPLSYRIPENLEESVRVGSAVVVPLSGHSRLGIVVGFDDEEERELEEVRAVREDLSLAEQIVRACEWICEVSAIPLAAALRSAMPPGLDIECYRVRDPAPGWRWKSGTLVGRTAIRRVLGRDELRTAESEGRVEFAPEPPQPREVEFAVIRPAAAPDLSRAPRQRALFECLKSYPTGLPVPELLQKSNANRPALRELVRRGAATLERRAEPPPVYETVGATTESVRNRLRNSEESRLERGSWLRRVPTADFAGSVDAAVRGALERDQTALVLVPEIAMVDEMVRYLRRSLPEGYGISAYHSGIGRGRGLVYGAARNGAVDVVVGTRTAALLPLPGLGIICVVDEPNESHRADPGYEGLPIHVRDIAIKRAETDPCAVLCLSPTPTLRLYAARGKSIRELPESMPERWPVVRILDMRGSGAMLSTTVVSACREAVEAGERVALISNRLGYATVVACNRCGAVKTCPRCDNSLTLFDNAGYLMCTRCNYNEPSKGVCDACGAGRLSATGAAIERIRAEVAASVGEPIGLLTASERLNPDAPLVVGTHRSISSSQEWDMVVVVDADTLLLGSGMGSVERAFRMLHGAAEVARGHLFVQTRVPEHYALQAAVRDDYRGFAAVELPRLRQLGYPPFSHLASITFEGTEQAVRHAVELRLRPVLDRAVDMTNLVALPGTVKSPAWRVLMRGDERSAVASAGAVAARVVGTGRRVSPESVRVRVDVDPEEV